MSLEEIIAYSPVLTYCLSWCCGSCTIRRTSCVVRVMNVSALLVGRLDHRESRLRFWQTFVVRWIINLFVITSKCSTQNVQKHTQKYKQCHTFEGHIRALQEPYCVLPGQSAFDVLLCWYGFLLLYNFLSLSLWASASDKYTNKDFLTDWKIQKYYTHSHTKKHLVTVTY